MREHPSVVVYLREMAIKWRLLADEMLDERLAISLRNLADEYDKAAQVEHQTVLLQGNPDSMA